MSHKADSRSGRKGSNNLVALGSMAVLGVYAAGYARTEAAAERFAQAAQRRPAAVIARAPEASTTAPAVAPTAQVTPAVPAAAASSPVSPTQSTSAATSTPVNGAKQPKAAATVAAKGAKDSSAVATVPAREPAKPATVVAAIAAPAKPAATAAPAAPAAHTDSAPPKTAPAAQPAIDSTALKAPAWKDGAYIGYGTSRHGDIEATIEIRNGKIISASISQCRTQYSCSWIAALPPQVITRQSAEVDYISGATQSSNAFYGAIVDALNKAK